MMFFFATHATRQASLSSRAPQTTPRSTISFAAWLPGRTKKQLPRWNGDLLRSKGNSITSTCDSMISVAGLELSSSSSMTSMGWREVPVWEALNRVHDLCPVSLISYVNYAGAGKSDTRATASTSRLLVSPNAICYHFSTALEACLSGSRTQLLHDDCTVLRCSIFCQLHMMSVGGCFF